VVLLRGLFCVLRFFILVVIKLLSLNPGARVDLQVISKNVSFIFFFKYNTVNVELGILFYSSFLCTIGVGFILS